MNMVRFAFICFYLLCFIIYVRIYSEVFGTMSIPWVFLGLFFRSHMSIVTRYKSRFHHSLNNRSK